MLGLPLGQSLGYSGLMRCLPFVILIGLTGCATFPELDGTISDAARNAPYPRLTALPATETGPVPDTTEAAMAARVAALNARAERLRRTEIAALQ